MNKLISMLVAAVFLLLSNGAQALVYQLDFSASSFSPGIFSNTAAPQSPVSGSFVFSAPSPGAAVTSLDAVNLVIAGHTYSLSEVGFGTYADGYLFGAKANGVGINRASTDDFYLILSSNYSVFSYAQQGVFDTWVTRALTTTISQQVAGTVPEPSATAMLLAGLAALGLWRLRLKRTAPAPMPMPSLA